jgi:hypothetical protein
MRNSILITIAVFFISMLSAANLEIMETEREYSIKYSTDTTSYKILRFSKGFEDSLFTYMNYSRSNKTDGFEREMTVLDSLFEIADGKIELSLRSASIGYPLEFDDVMPEYIRAFLNSEQWTQHIKVKGKELDYKLMRKVILDSGVFYKFKEVLRKYGYEIKELSTEKHGFILKKDLIGYGFSGSEIVPVPFMLYWQLEKK